MPMRSMMPVRERMRLLPARSGAGKSGTTTVNGMMGPFLVCVAHENALVFPAAADERLCGLAGRVPIALREALARALGRAQDLELVGAELVEECDGDAHDAHVRATVRTHSGVSYGLARGGV